MNTQRSRPPIPPLEGHPAGWRTRRPAGHAPGRGHLRPAGLVRRRHRRLRPYHLIPVGGGDNSARAPVQTVTRTVVVGGMAGWQIALIAFGAALAAAAAAVVLDRKLAGRGRAAVAA